jgi:thymidylate synthase (FAD)
MKLIKPYTEILSTIDGDAVLKAIEQVARTCYKSEDLITDDSAKKMVSNLLRNGHEAMIEFYDVTVKFVCDRGVSHEVVRHRVASYAQESTRYCNYSKDKFGNELTFIIPCWTGISEQSVSSPIDNGGLGYTEMHGNADDDKWIRAMSYAEEYYKLLMSDTMGWSAQQARSVLPNSLKTEINVKMNLREWRHFFRLRCAPAAHPQMRELTIPLLEKMHDLVPIIFDDLYEKYCK